MLNRNTTIAIVAVLVLGLVASSMIIGGSLKRFRSEDRYISVKGFSEREVKADLVIWTLKVVVGSNNLQEGSEEMKNTKKKVRQFLIENGIASGEITEKDLTVQDRQANLYEVPNANYTFRYIIGESIEVRSQKVDQVQQASRKTGELLNAGVVLSSEVWNGTGLRFIFTKLNEIKPKMLTEAINNARSAAEQFSRESGTDLGALRKASQGFFSIQDRDEFLSGQSEGGNPYPQGKSDMYKTIRVVVSAEYSVE